MLQTTWFYAPPSAFHGEWVTLPEEEAHHVSNVLRGGTGEEIVVVDGEGGWYRVRLEELQDKHVTAQVLEDRREIGEPSYRLTLGIGLLKRRRRFETFLEKAVELGVSRIIPLATEHTEKQSIREDRAQRVMTAAMKQSQRSRLPTLMEVAPLEDVLEMSSEEIHLVCHGHGPEVEPLGTYLQSGSARDISVLIGPEGGFSSREIERLRAHGWMLAGLGNRRLRTETAGIAVAAVVQGLHET